jgi:hypothetical protein
LEPRIALRWRADTNAIRSSPEEPGLRSEVDRDSRTGWRSQASPVARIRPERVAGLRHREDLRDRGCAKLSCPRPDGARPRAEMFVPRARAHGLRATRSSAVASRISTANLPVALVAPQRACLDDHRSGEAGRWLQQRAGPQARAGSPATRTFPGLGRPRSPLGPAKARCPRLQGAERVDKEGKRRVCRASGARRQDSARA